MLITCILGSTPIEVLVGALVAVLVEVLAEADEVELVVEAAMEVEAEVEAVDFPVMAVDSMNNATNIKREIYVETYLSVS